MEISIRDILNYVEFRTILHPMWCRAVTFLTYSTGRKRGCQPFGKTSEKLDPFGDANPRLPGWRIKRRSELALSEVEGVNPEQTQHLYWESRG